MMRMIEAGGVPVLAKERSTKPMNEFSPYGLYEYSDVAAELREHPVDWTADKVIKIVAPFIHFLPEDRECRVVFMLRDLTEVITSLLAARHVWRHSPDELVRAARNYLAKRDVSTHFVNYRDMLAYPRATAMGVADFLELDADLDAMAGVVDRNARTKVRNVMIKKGNDEPLLLFEADRILTQAEMSEGWMRGED